MDQPPPEIAPIKKGRKSTGGATGGGGRKRKTPGAQQQPQPTDEDQQQQQPPAPAAKKKRTTKKKVAQNTADVQPSAQDSTIQSTTAAPNTGTAGGAGSAEDDEDIIVNPTNPSQQPQQPQQQLQQQQQDEEEEELDDDVVAKPSQTIGREETKAILDTFDDITHSRYEVFRRAHLTKATMKKIVTNLVGPVPASVAIVVSGVGKIFVGEMVESALEIMDERGETGPIAPQHLREAFRRYQKMTDTIQNKLYKPQIF